MIIFYTNGHFDEPEGLTLSSLQIPDEGDEGHFTAVAYSSLGYKPVVIGSDQSKFDQIISDNGLVQGINGYVSSKGLTNMTTWLRDILVSNLQIMLAAFKSSDFTEEQLATMFKIDDISAVHDAMTMDPIDVVAEKEKMVATKTAFNAYKKKYEDGAAAKMVDDFLKSFITP